MSQIKIRHSQEVSKRQQEQQMTILLSPIILILSISQGAHNNVFHRMWMAGWQWSPYGRRQ